MDDPARRESGETSGEVQGGFTLRYEGPALATGRMAVRDLAPALLALGDLFQEAQRIVDPMAPPVSLEVRAFGRGSFAADLHVAMQEILNVLGSPTSMTIGNLVGLIVDSSQGLFALYKWLRHHQIAGKEETRPGTTTVHDNHGNVFTADTQVFNVYDSSRARHLAKEVVRPLKEPGIDRLEIERRGQVLEVESEEVETFEAAVRDQVLVENEFEVYLTLVAPVFRPNNKWRFSLGDRDVWATIEDAAFLEEVFATGRELFGAGDVFRCRVKMRQKMADTGTAIDTEYVVLQVLEHHRGGMPPTPQLPFGDGERYPE